MKRLTVDTNISFCDIAQCSSMPGGSWCENGKCDQRRCYERLREYERTGMEPEEVRRMKETLEAALKDLKKHASCGVCSFKFCHIRGGVEPCNFQYQGTKEETDQ